MATVSNVSERRGLVTIYLDDERWCAVKKKHFDRLPLEAGEEIDPESYSDRLAAAQMNDCYESALYILDRADRTKKDIIARLIRGGYVDKAAEACAERLQENGLIDEKRIAERLTQSQMDKNAGYYAALRKLRSRQLGEDEIESAMLSFDGEQQSGACRSAAKKLLPKYEKLPAREARAKLSQALARRGFTWDSISAALDDVLNSDFDDLT